MLGLLLAAAAAAAPQPAAQPSIDQDVRCLLVMSAVTGAATNPEAKQSGLYGTLIWYGRLSARMSAAEIGAAARREGVKMTKEFFTTEAQRCSGEMMAYGASMQALGAEMKQADAKPDGK